MIRELDDDNRTLPVIGNWRISYKERLRLDAVKPREDGERILSMLRNT